MDSYEIQTSNPYFYRKVIKIGVPIFLSQFFISLLSIIDTVMVSVLGDEAIAAVGLAANFGFFIIMILFGFLSGLGIYIAQYWGSKDIKSIHKVFIITIIVGAIISTVFFVLVHFFPQFIIGLYNNGDDLVQRAIIKEYAMDYFKVISFSYFTMTANFVIIMLMRNTEQVVFPQIVSVITVLVNTFLNYGLINGNMGFPSMEVKGAAYASLISSGLGFFILLISMFIINNEVLKVKFRLYKEITREFVDMLAKKALPVALNETIWGLGMSTYLMAMGFIGGYAISSVQISNMIMGMFWVANAGISTACAIMIGNKLGENQIDVAKKWGLKFTRLSFVSGLVLGIMLFMLRSSIPLVFTNASDLVKDNVESILFVFSFYIPIKFVNAIQIIGTLRAGGDTKYALLSEIIPLWLIGVPLAFILSLYTSLPLWAIMAIINVEEIVKFGIVIRRFFSYKWANNLTTD